MRLALRSLAVAVAVIVVGITLGGRVYAQTTTRVSVDTAGFAFDKDSWCESISASGRHVAFTRNTSPGVDNVWVHDRVAGTTECASVTTTGAPGSDTSRRAALSGDGRWEVFESDSQNLVAGYSPASSVTDVYVHDRRLEVTDVVNRNDAGAVCSPAHGPSVSPDGRFVSFSSVSPQFFANDHANSRDVFARGRLLGVTELVSIAASGTASLGQASASDRALSADGRYVVFVSDAFDLVSGPFSSIDQVYLRDRTSATSTMLSLTPDGNAGGGPSRVAVISDDGRFVAFESDASNLVANDTNGSWGVFLRDVVGRHDGAGQHRTEWKAIFLRVLRGDDLCRRQLRRLRHLPSAVPLGHERRRGRPPARPSRRRTLHREPELVRPDLRRRCHGPAQRTHRHRELRSGGRLRQHLDRSRAERRQPPLGRLRARPRVHRSGRDVLHGEDQQSRLRAEDRREWITSASVHEALRLTATQARNQKQGISFWGYTSASLPIGGGTLCVAPPIVRTSVQNSGGSSSGTDCTGGYAFAADHAYLATVAVPYGSVIHGQYWSRAPGFLPPQNVGFTDGIAFVISP